MLNEVDALKLSDKQLKKLAKIAKRTGITLKDAIEIYGEGMLYPDKVALKIKYSQYRVF
jgi:hypothetical protein